MEKYIDLEQAFKQKPEITNVVKELNTYFKQRTIATKPDSNAYDKMYDFVQSKKSALLGASYFPLSKFERRFASKLYDVLHIENIIHKRISASEDTWSDPNIDKRNHKLYTTRRELFEVIFSSICISKESEKKVLNTFTPDELVLLCDLFEEEIIANKSVEEDESRTQELAAWVGGDDDDTDVAATFYDKVIQHHAINRPIGDLLEDMLNTRKITYARLFKKTMENAHIMRGYFWRYPEVFIVSYCTILTYEQMNKAVEKIFPKQYPMPDIKSYIDRRYDKENPDEQYGDND